MSASKEEIDEEDDKRSFDKKLFELLKLNIYWNIAQLLYKPIEYLVKRLSKGKSSVERISLYVHFWVFMALILTFFSYLPIFKTLKLYEFLWAAVFNFFVIFFVPMGFLWLGIIFSSIELEEKDRINSIKKPSKGDFFPHWQGRVFSAKDYRMYLLPLLIIVVSFIVLLYPKLHFTVERTFNGGYTFTFYPAVDHLLMSHKFLFLDGLILFFLCGHSAYINIVSLIFQFKIVHLPYSFKFMETGNKMIYYLSNYSYILSLLLFSGYILLFLAIKALKFDSNTVFNIYLAVLSIFPPLSLAWGIIHIHTFQVKVKFNHLTTIEKEISRVGVDCNQSQNLAKLIEIKKYINKMPEWPVSLQSLTTLGITSAAVIIQILYMLGIRLH